MDIKRLKETFGEAFLCQRYMPNEPDILLKVAFEIKCNGVYIKGSAKLCAITSIWEIQLRFGQNELLIPTSKSVEDWLVSNKKFLESWVNKIVVNKL